MRRNDVGWLDMFALFQIANKKYTHTHTYINQCGNHSWLKLNARVEYYVAVRLAHEYLHFVLFGLKPDNGWTLCSINRIRHQLSVSSLNTTTWVFFSLQAWFPDHAARKRNAVCCEYLLWNHSAQLNKINTNNNRVSSTLTVVNCLTHTGVWCALLRSFGVSHCSFCWHCCCLFNAHSTDFYLFVLCGFIVCADCLFRLRSHEKQYTGAHKLELFQFNWPNVLHFRLVCSRLSWTTDLFHFQFSECAN